LKELTFSGGSGDTDSSEDTDSSGETDEFGDIATGSSFPMLLSPLKTYKTYMIGYYQ
jgi:hypothetical protein